MAEYTKEEYTCVVRGTPYATLHHIYSRGAHPTLADEPENMIPVCDEIHKLWHSKGTVWMQNKFPRIRTWLSENGWELDPVLWKWVNYGLLKKESSYTQAPQSSSQSSRRRLVSSRPAEKP